MDKEKRRKIVKESVKEREKEKRRVEEICKCEEKMNKDQMPEWAKVLYHQNKAILAELGIEE